MKTEHKPIVSIAETAGFCFGVNRAVNMVHSLLSDGNRVATLGPIIHNKQVVEELQAKGVSICESAEDAEKETILVIRSHGVSSNVYEILKEKGIPYCDATCPFVEKIHKIVHQAALQNKAVLIAGDPNHPEILGIRGFAGSCVYCYQTPDELEKLLNNHSFLHTFPLVSVCQTTFDKNLWKKCEKILKKVCTNAIFFDTICDATSKRQQEAEELARNNDLMIVVGGRHSSNTVKLFSICQRHCPTLHIEHADELDREYISRFGRIGVTAGA